MLNSIYISSEKWFQFFKIPRVKSLRWEGLGQNPPRVKDAYIWFTIGCEGQMDGWTDRPSCRDTMMHLKIKGGGWWVIWDVHMWFTIRCDRWMDRLTGWLTDLFIELRWCILKWLGLVGEWIEITVLSKRIWVKNRITVGFSAFLCNVGVW